MIAYVNGQYIAEELATVSIFDRGFLFADAVYEVTAIINGKLVDLANHLARLQRSCKELQLTLPLSLFQLEHIHDELMKKNGLEEGLIYLQLTRGNALQRNFLYPDKDVNPTLVLFAQKANIVNSPKAKSGIKVVSVDDIRWGRCDIKTVSLLAACMAKEYARQRGVDDAIFVRDGYITEGSSSNCFIVNSANQLQTRGLNNEILPGITRQAILVLAKEQNLELIEKPFSLNEMLMQKEAFITSATTLVFPIVEVNDQQIGKGKPGDIAVRLREIYLQKVN